MAKKNKDELTPFEQQFVDVWFNMGFNGRLAYKQIKPGVTNETAEVNASKLLSLTKVQDYIELKREQIRIKEDIQLSWVVQELKSIILDVKQEQTERDPTTNKIYIKPDRKSALAALAQLSKIAGFEVKKEDKENDNEQPLFGPISDE
jgi:hypothetical protein